MVLRADNTDDTTVTFSGTGFSQTITGLQRELPGTPQVTWEQLAAAMANEEYALEELNLAKSEVKDAKKVWEDAARDLRKLSRRWCAAQQARRINPDTGEVTD